GASQLRMQLFLAPVVVLAFVEGITELPSLDGVFLTVFGVGLAALSIFVLIAEIPSAGKPRVVLTREGFSTPLTPLIPWSSVDGIHLRPVGQDGLFCLRNKEVLLYELVFRIPELPQLVCRFALFYRMAFRLRRGEGRSRLSVILVRPSEAPEAVHKV